MHEKVLPKHGLDLLKRLEGRKHPALSGWTLAGGTGLALQLGHRISEDLDFFRTDEHDVRSLHAVFEQLGAYETLQDAENTLTVIARKTKVSFFRVRDPFLFPAIPYRFFQLADLRDIALMKLADVSGRGARKDFIDLFYILKTGVTLRDCFEALPKKYRPERLNVYHILKSLTYFDDAESEPMPRMLERFDWKKCRSFFLREARAIVVR
jgi:predicted nucleotidyltransferase component of viral defense system